MPVAPPISWKESSSFHIRRYIFLSEKEKISTGLDPNIYIFDQKQVFFNLSSKIRFMSHRPDVWRFSGCTVRQATNGRSPLGEARTTRTLGWRQKLYLVAPPLYPGPGCGVSGRGIQRQWERRLLVSERICPAERRYCSVSSTIIVLWFIGDILLVKCAILFQNR